MLHREPEYRRRIRQKAEENQRRSDEERYESAKDGRTDKVLGAVERLVKQVDRYTDEESPENKRKRRGDFIRWAFETTGLWAAAAVGVWAIISGRQDADTQRRIMLADQRPWVSLAPDDGIAITEPLTFTTDGLANMRLSYRLRNSGKSPGLHVRFKAKIISLPGKDFIEAEMASAQADFCDPIRSVANEFYDAVIFPGDQPISAYPLSMAPGDVKIAISRKETGALAHKGYVSLSVIVCIDYQRPAVPGDHLQTRYAYLLGVPVENGAVMGDIDPTGSRSDVRLIFFSQSAE